jgi:hypothetical protein
LYVFSQIRNIDVKKKKGHRSRRRTIVGKDISTRMRQGEERMMEGKRSQVQ